MKGRLVKGGDGAGGFGDDYLAMPR
jgi:hypothetical protein